MSDPLHHAMSSAKKFGGTFHDYIELHMWFDATKEMGVPTPVHRMFRHHAEGIGWAIERFGSWIEVIHNGERRFISTRMVAEQHMKEDFGYTPTMAEWAKHVNLQPWMFKNAMAAPHRTHIGGPARGSTSEAPPAVMNSGENGEAPPAVMNSGENKEQTNA